ncbi:MAG: ATP-binding protein [Armatimonadota bacterium]
MKYGDTVAIEIPTSLEYLAVIRKTLDVIAKRLHLDDNRANELKVAVGEACTNAVKHSKCDENSHDNVQVKYVREESGLSIEIRNNNNDHQCQALPDSVDLNREGGMGLFIISQLMDEVNFYNENNTTIMKMTKKLSD